jgi:hypothetical protein
MQAKYWQKTDALNKVAHVNASYVDVIVWMRM